MVEVFPMVEPSSRAGTWLWVVVGVALLVMMVVMGLLGWTLWAARHTTFEVSPEGLRIRGDVWGRLVPAGVLRGQEARAVDLGRESELRPKWRTMGTGLPGYASGWFRLRDGQKALLFLTDHRRVVYVPTTEGYVVLLSTPEPERMVEVLRRMGGGG